MKLDLQKITQTLVAGEPDDAVLLGSTSTASGRVEKDRNALYITTNGGISGRKVAGLAGGKVVALDTRRLRGLPA